MIFVKRISNMANTINYITKGKKKKRKKNRVCYGASAVLRGATGIRARKRYTPDTFVKDNNNHEPPKKNQQT